MDEEFSMHGTDENESIITAFKRCDHLEDTGGDKWTLE
jgi:hypothetical protein